MEQEYFQSEIHRLLKLGPDLSKPYQPLVPQEPEAPPAPVPQITATNTGAPLDLPVPGLPIAGLPIAPAASAPIKPVSFSSASVEGAATAEYADEIVPNFNPNSILAQPTEFRIPPQELKPAKPQPAPRKMPSGRTMSGLLVYPVVFIVAFAFFYVILNFNALAVQVSGWFAKDESEAILEEDLPEYQKWIGGYYFAVGDKEKLEPNNDIDIDGLSNLDEFKIKTNPTVADSDADGVSDGIEVINGTNPWGTGKMSDRQKKTLEGLDMIKVNNRISFNAAAKNPALALGQHTDNFDMTKPGRLSVPKLNLQVPIIWTQDPAEFDKDLTRGVVHYPGTALPGEIGTVYVSGHSSDYFWKNHPYKQVFAKINALEPGDDIFIDVYGKDGKIYNYKYRVTRETIYAPDDQAQFVDNSGAKLNLSTCWPIGTQKDRYVVTAELQNL
jgi:LPXTG-site transpeptidase (sortase) family protein